MLKILLLMTLSFLAVSSAAPADPAPGIQEDDTTYALKLGYEW